MEWLTNGMRYLLYSVQNTKHNSILCISYYYHNIIVIIIIIIVIVIVILIFMDSSRGAGYNQ